MLSTDDIRARRRLIPLPPQDICQISNPQRRTRLTLNSIRVINAQNLQSLWARYRLTRGSPTPKTDAQDGALVYGKHPHLIGAKVEGPRMVKEPLHPTPHQWMVHLHIWDAEEGAKTQLCQKLSILSTRNI